MSFLYPHPLRLFVHKVFKMTKKLKIKAFLDSAVRDFLQEHSGEKVSKNQFAHLSIDFRYGPYLLFHQVIIGRTPGTFLFYAYVILHCHFLKVTFIF